MRASDADRDQVADRLREALAEGRITPEEHAERIDLVYRAKTYAELEPVLSDLPAVAGARPRVDLRKEEAPLAAPPPPQSPHIVAVFGGAERKGRWLVQRSTNVTCVFAGVDVDFRQAVLSQAEVTVNVVCIFGGVDLVVPPGVRVVGSNVAVFGGNDWPEDDTVAPDAPVIRVTGVTLFGGVSVTRKELKRPKKDRKRELRRLHERRHGH
ncbi:DUF1707 domain-containing protein [Actinomadura sp. GC306]|nr:DUF1707 domain-containing protein [Actinomadura sp. GC306]TDC69784.1 DUF1707 domain-containing protein [Actinomadura sp. GC306]